MSAETTRFQELEACKNMIKKLEEEAKVKTPFDSEYVKKSKLDEYIILLQRLQALMQKENDLLGQITGV